MGAPVPDEKAYAHWKDRWERIDAIKKAALDEGVNDATAEARAAWVVDNEDRARREREEMERKYNSSKPPVKI